MAEAVSTFISYSRTDTDFVDRLEADLRARGFNTWVDRRKLEGTREWQPQIDRAIAEHPLMIVVLSPDAIASPYVRHEYEYAHELGKRIVTLLQKPNLPTVPPELSEIQWVDFVNHPYETALVELIDGCQDPLFDQASDPRTLYNEAHDLEFTDPERAAILYQRLLNRAPTYAGGRAKVDLDRLNQQLYTKRAQGLREQAEAVHKEGQYGAEAGALKALIALGGQDRGILAWAEEYLPIAEKNSAWLDTYENVKHCVAVNDKERARDLLTDLWRKEHAPFFRDPADVAPTLGLTVPMTYEEAKERRLADEEKAKRERDAATECDIVIAQAQSRAKTATDKENAKWQAASSRHVFLWTTFIVILTVAVVIMGVVLVANVFPPGSPEAFWSMLIISAISVFLSALICVWIINVFQRPLARQAKQKGQSIETESLRLTTQAQAQYQQRMDEIAAEHARMLAEIAARYAGA